MIQRVANISNYHVPTKNEQTNKNSQAKINQKGQKGECQGRINL